MERLRKAWGWLLALGIVMVLLGLFAIAAPLATTLAVGLVLGWLLIIGGVVRVADAFAATAGWAGFLFQLLSGILYVVVGGFLVFDPLGGVLALTILLAVFLVVEGILQIVMAFRVRPQQNWGWLAASGLVTVVLGILIWSEWPSSALWVLGLMVGIQLVFTGWSLVMLALAGRRAATSGAA